MMMNGLNRSRLAVCRPSLLILDQLFVFVFAIHETLTHDTHRIMSDTDASALSFYCREYP